MNEKVNERIEEKLIPLSKIAKIKNTHTVIEESKYPDSIELDFGGTGKRAKLYFNASDLIEAKQRLKNVIELNAEKEKILGGVVDESKGKN
jgi:hypothetical protein